MYVHHCPPRRGFESRSFYRSKARLLGGVVALPITALEDVKSQTLKHYRKYSIELLPIFYRIPEEQLGIVELSLDSMSSVWSITTTVKLDRKLPTGCFQFVCTTAFHPCLPRFLNGQAALGQYPCRPSPDRSDDKADLAVSPLLVLVDLRWELGARHKRPALQTVPQTIPQQLLAYANIENLVITTCVPSSLPGSCPLAGIVRLLVR